MLFYSSANNSLLLVPIELDPKSCFLMYQQSGIDPEDAEVLKKVKQRLKYNGIKPKDAMSEVGGGDYLEKIKRLMIGVPTGVAIVSKGTRQGALNNIFYELGMMDAMGKETIIVSDGEVEIPSNLARTEYVLFSELTKFSGRLTNILDRATFYVTMAELMEQNPLAAIDYYFRSYLISGDKKCIRNIEQICQTATLSGNSEQSVENILLKSLRKSRSQQRKVKKSNQPKPSQP